MNSEIKSDSFDNWLPFKIYRRDEETLVDWCYADSVRLTEPFFEMTIRRAGRREAPSGSAVRRTPLGFLRQLSEAAPGIQPTGFIFHLSRCGSTLISQMLAAADKNIVISEAPPLDTVIRTRYQEAPIAPSKRANDLKFLISALGQKRFDEEKYLFIKFDCWHTLNLNLIAQAFPAVPWIFLYRNPVEVIVSHLRQRGMQMMPGVIENLLPDFDLRAILQMSAEEYCARVLEEICRSALEYAENPNALLINYTQLPEAACAEIPKHFGVSYDFEDLEKMSAAAKFDAKMPQVVFTSDVKSKNAEASSAVREAAAKYAEPYYEKLEALRLKNL